jgi:methionine synthase II (cobalamin-independent)
VHLVGSVGLDSVPDVFRTLGRTLGRRLKRVPDGEVGGRRLWVSWQYPLFRANPFLVVTDTARRPTGFLEMRLADGVRGKDVVFGELGYAREARASFIDFTRAQERGELPPNVRFQVCLPTPFAVVNTCCAPSDAGEIEQAYERAMAAEIESLCAEIPHGRLSIQWDVCIEMVIWDGQEWRGRTQRKDVSNEEILARMQRICASTPNDVELGIHLCYGDFEAKHFIEPRDASKMVEFANALAKAIPHPLAFIHMPVPIERDDDAFFKPFDELRLDPSTEIYLGLVHAKDGVEGTRNRIAAANKHVPQFGIACECGIARARRPDLVHSILAVHAGTAREPDQVASARDTHGLADFAMNLFALPAPELEVLFDEPARRRIGKLIGAAMLRRNRRW